MENEGVFARVDVRPDERPGRGRIRRARRTSAGHSRPGTVDTVARSSRLDGKGGQDVSCRTCDPPTIAVFRWLGATRFFEERRQQILVDERQPAQRVHTVAVQAIETPHNCTQRIALALVGGRKTRRRQKPPGPAQRIRQCDHPFWLCRDVFHPTRDRDGRGPKLVTQGRDTGESGRRRRTGRGRASTRGCAQWSSW